MPNFDDPVTWADLQRVARALGGDEAADKVLRLLLARCAEERIAPVPAPAKVEPYEAPEVAPLGNLNGLLAGGGSQLCDGIMQEAGDHNGC